MYYIDRPVRIHSCLGLTGKYTYLERLLDSKDEDSGKRAKPEVRGLVSRYVDVSHSEDENEGVSACKLPQDAEGLLELILKSAYVRLLNLSPSSDALIVFLDQMMDAAL